ncbi:MAG: hypothetical protein CM15mV80_620 [uncultured marine virus]|nr:MAG: hypothetical protein CM15mV80_620 [uncultured marine virus]
MRYIDYASDYLPGEVYRSGMKEYTPQIKRPYMMKSELNKALRIFAFTIWLGL